MVLFAVTLSSASEEKLSRLTRCLSDAFAELHTKAADLGIWEVDAEAGRLYFVSSKERKPGKQMQSLIARKAALGLAEYVLLEAEPRMLRLIARKQFHYEQEDELQKIEWHCRQLLQGSEAQAVVSGPSPDVRERRKRKVAAELEAFLLNQPDIHIDGFITFRLSSYWEELREVVEYAVDEFVMDKQYQEFISLLKYFVCLQEPKAGLVHLVHIKDTEFLLYDEKMEPIDHKPADRIVAEMLETEMNVEDMVVSNLITISPQEVVIHTTQEDLPVIRTIEAIFDSRVTICSGCHTCRPYTDERLRT